MSRLQIILDTIMCILWMTTYTLVLIGTIKYRYPMISPVTQAIIAPFEFSVVLYYAVAGYVQINYALIAYLYWTIVEVAIFFAIINTGYISKKQIMPYIVTVAVITGIMFWLVAVRGKMLFFSYLNTFIGNVFWARFILNKDYPMKSFALASFCTKFLADTAAVLVYHGAGSLVTDLICVLLPALDFFFIIIYFNRRKRLNK